MLKITQNAGFGAGGGGTDVTPAAIDFSNISDVGTDPVAFTNAVAFSGIDTTITLRLTLTAGMTFQRFVEVYRNGAFASSVASGTTIDVTVTNGQTLMYGFYNAHDLSTWSGTATVTNLSDGGAVLDAFSYTLQDTGDGVGVGGVGVFVLPP